jgi:hypothetical protein
MFTLRKFYKIRIKEDVLKSLQNTIYNPNHTALDSKLVLDFFLNTASSD